MGRAKLAIELRCAVRFDRRGGKRLGDRVVGFIGNLNQLYQSTCLKAPEVPVACADDGGVDDSGTDGGDVSDAADETDGRRSTGDAATTDAMDEDAAIATSTDGGVSDADAAPPPCVTYESACTLFTDYTVATTSMSTFDIRVTRLRTTLPASALSVDLALAASLDQSQLSNTIQTTAYDNPNYYRVEMRRRRRRIRTKRAADASPREKIAR